MSLQRARKKSDSTPPGSFTKQPLDPPPLEQTSGTPGGHIFPELEDHKSGRGYSTNHWQRYKLSPAEYKFVEQRLQPLSMVLFSGGGVKCSPPI